MIELDRIYIGDCSRIMRRWPPAIVQSIVTSPPYWGLRDYGVKGQLGMEKNPESYIREMVYVFREARRVLRDDGTLWLNMGDSYNNDRTGGHGATGGANKSTLESPGPKGHSPVRKHVDSHLKPKDLIGMPWRLALALQADGWYLRSDIIWAKPNPMPESVTDRPTRAHEYIFLLTKNARYYYDADAIKEKGISNPQSWKTADGWDTSTGNGGHGSFHKEGREKGFKGYKSLPEGQQNIRATREKLRGKPDGNGRNDNFNHQSGGFKKQDKQRGHSRRHDGFNDRWDQMERAEQCSGMRNKRSVWTVATSPFPQAHFATFPPELIKPCILAGSCRGDTVLDPFMGAGTTALVAAHYNRHFLGIELNPEYVTIAEHRIAAECAQLKFI